MKITEITSAVNPQFKIFKSLLSSKGIKEHQQFFLMGEKLVSEFLKNPLADFKIEFIVTFESLAFKTDEKVTLLKKELFKELDVMGTHSAMLVLSYSSFKEKNLNDLPNGLEIICPLGDPRNLGALARTALGFQVNQFILTQEAAHPFLPQAIKASSGACLKIQFFITQQKLCDLPLTASNYALELHGTDLAKVKWPLHLRLWLGEEGSGLGLSELQKKTMHFIHIPTQNIESLNATVSASLALWEYFKSSSKTEIK